MRPCRSRAQCRGLPGRAPRSGRARTATRPASRAIVPGRQVFLPMRPGRLRNALADQRFLGGIGLLVELSAQLAEAAPQQVGIDGVGFAVGADRVDSPFAPGGPDLISRHAELAGESAKTRDLVQ